MEVTRACTVVVVAETDRLHRLVSTAVNKLGPKLRSGRAVKAEAKRFADKIAANPKSLRVEVLDVVGFCDPDKDRPDLLEPIVIEDGRASPVTHTYLGVSGDYRIVLSTKLDETRDTIIASSARTIALELFLDVAMAEAVYAADQDLTLAGMMTDAKTLTVELDGDDDGKIGKRLPKWIKVESDEEQPGP